MRAYLAGTEHYVVPTSLRRLSATICALAVNRPIPVLTDHEGLGSALAGIALGYRLTPLVGSQFRRSAHVRVVAGFREKF
jgi:hypothetical protein